MKADKFWKILPWIIIIILIILLIFLKSCCGENFITAPDNNNLPSKDSLRVKGKVVNTTNSESEKVNTFPKIKNTLYSISRYGAGVFLVTGSKGLVVTTPNGGMNWNIRTPNINNHLYGSAVLNYDTMIAVGEKGKIIISNDKGVTWNSVNSTTNLNIRSVSFPNKFTGYAVGDSGLIIKSTNSGFSWDTLPPKNNYGLTSVCFIDSNIGWIAGEKGSIYKTVDGGNNWTNQHSDTSCKITSISFSSLNRGTAVGSSSKILNTNDGGNTWTSLLNNNSTMYYGVHRASNNLAYVVGKGVILRIDKTNIKQIYTNATETYNAVDPAPYISGIAVGNNAATVYVNAAGCNCNNDANNELILYSPNDGTNGGWKYTFRIDRSRNFKNLVRIVTPGMIINSTIIRGWTQMDGEQQGPREVVTNINCGSQIPNFVFHSLPYNNSANQSDAATLFLSNEHYGSVELNLETNPNNSDPQNSPGTIEFYFADISDAVGLVDTSFCHKSTYTIGQ